MLQDVSLAGYRLEHHAGGEETAYKFHRNIVLKAGESCTVSKRGTSNLRS